MADIYVATTGNDTTGDGSIGNPYATPQKALNVASTVGGFTIWLSDGTYICTVANSGQAYLKLQKSFTSPVTMRSLTANATGDPTLNTVIIRGDGSAVYNVLFSGGAVTGLNFRDLTFGGPSGGTTYVIECSTANNQTCTWTGCYFLLPTTALAGAAGFRLNANSAVTQTHTFVGSVWDMSAGSNSPTALIVQGTATYNVSVYLTNCTMTSPFRALYVLGGRAEVIGGHYTTTGTIASEPLIFGGDSLTGTLTQVVTGFCKGAGTTNSHSHGIITGAGAQNFVIDLIYSNGADYGCVQKACVGTVARRCIFNPIGGIPSIPAKSGLFLKGAVSSDVQNCVMPSGTTSNACFNNDDGDTSFQAHDNSVIHCLALQQGTGQVYRWKPPYETNFSIVGATNSSPCVINVPAHGFNSTVTNSANIRIVQATGLTQINGTFYVKYVDADHLSLYLDMNLATPLNTTAGGTYVTRTGQCQPNNVFDFNGYGILGSGNFGIVENTNPVADLPSAQTAWATSGAAGNLLNDVNSTLFPSTFNYTGTPGQTYYFIAYNVNGWAFNGTAYEPYDSSRWVTNYATPLYEQSAGSYIFPIPANIPVGTIYLSIYTTSLPWGFQSSADSLVVQQVYNAFPVGAVVTSNSIISSAAGTGTTGVLAPGSFVAVGPVPEGGATISVQIQNGISGAWAGTLNAYTTLSKLTRVLLPQSSITSPSSASTGITSGATGLFVFPASGGAMVYIICDTYVSGSAVVTMAAGV